MLFSLHYYFALYSIALRLTGADLVSDEVAAVCKNAPLPEGDSRPIYLPLPGSCGGFVECDVGGRDHAVHECPGGLTFNENLQMCDWPDNSDCYA
ncbi:hypothetical protein BCR43DRAFT_488891 [Syncephalastrum racemosum]|uniref:Chitin-binding type-2 domain-containing protein n=1 Tax=Syncephalastrum racemosum TaxID=13706 RepID=A0A1X2HJB8_SYNRA|nr:hypothetical protein BCR43DRAFT_488891 [Syncephalastrum racemosum]